MTSAAAKDDVVNNNRQVELSYIYTDLCLYFYNNICCALYSTENVLEYAVSLFDVDDYFVHSELKNFQNDNSINDGPARYV